MRRFSLWLLGTGLMIGLLALGCSDQPANVNGPQGLLSGNLAPLYKSTSSDKAVPDAYIVVLKSSVANVDHVIDDFGTTQAVTVNFRYRSALKGFAGKLSASQVDALRRDPRVAYIEQDQIAHIVASQPSPPSWGLDRVDQRNLPLDATYVYNQTGAGVDVYIIDTGIRVSHVDFGGRAVPGVDEITPGGTADDAHGHGTHVAGTVGGTSYGIAKSVHLIAVRVLDASGSGTYSQVIAGVDWVTADHTTHPAVANMSLGGPVSTALDDAVRASIADGVTYCVAAGNSATNASTQSPADVAEAITVGATDIADGFAWFSNYGSILDISAPGVSITSDWNTSNTATNTISGTSMATPHVAGSAALYLEANPTATPADVQSGLIASATSGVIGGIPSGTTNRLLYSVAAPPAPPGPPASPVLSAPGNGATGVAIPASLSWSASSGADSYEVQVASDTGFTTIVSDQAGITSTSTSASGLSNATIYYWRVNATNTHGTSAWSTVWSFTTAAPAPPPAPTLVSPSNGANNVSRTPTLRWNASAGATSYRVQVSTSPSFATLIYDQSGITLISTTVSGLGSKVTYYWRVNASNANGTSGWSSVWRFRTRR